MTCSHQASHLQEGHKLSQHLPLYVGPGQLVQTLGQVMTWISSPGKKMEHRTPNPWHFLFMLHQAVL